MKKIILSSLLIATCASTTPSLGQSTMPESLLATGDEFYVPKIVLDGPVDEMNMLLVITQIGMVTEAKADAIVLEINTPGGSIWDGFELVKVIENSKIPVICVVDNNALSMGFYILQSCNVRLMTKRSALMAHLPSVGGHIGGTAKEYENVSEGLRVTGEGLVYHMAHRMRISPEDMAAKLAGGVDWWMSYKDALIFGAVDDAVETVADVVGSYRHFMLPPKGKVQPALAPVPAP